MKKGAKLHFNSSWCLCILGRLVKFYGPIELITEVKSGRQFCLDVYGFMVKSNKNISQRVLTKILVLI